MNKLQNEVSALVSVLSFITRRTADLGQGDDEERIPSPSCSSEQQQDLGLADESLDEAEFDAPIGSDDENVDRIKRNSLDRLAEILAKFKSAKGAATSDDRNRDAKHVTGIIMVEDSSGKTAKFLCAKNEKHEQEGNTDEVFDLMLAHQSPRVMHYSTVLFNSFKESHHSLPPTATLTSENLRKRPRQCATRRWTDNNDLEFDIQIVGTGEDSFSDNAADCLSDQADENLVQEVFRDIQHHFGGEHPVPPSAIKSLLKSLYSIIRHPRRRPAFKALLRSVLHGRRHFTRAWSSLLYLTRIYYAAVTFEHLASKSGFASITFQQISPPAVYTGKYGAGKTPNQVLRSLGHQSLPNWGKFFSQRDKVKEFTKTSRKQKPIHAEVQLITHVLQQAPAHEKLGVLCRLCRIGGGPLQSRGSHLTLFALWALPESIPPPAVDLVQGLANVLKTLLQGFLSAPSPPFQINMLQQSSAALSTAKAVQRERPEYTTRPQVSSRMMFGFGGVLATDQQMEVVPSFENSGFATVLGGQSKYGPENEVPIYEAEVAKINYDRKRDGLEEMREMPPPRIAAQRLCRRCRSLAKYSCRTCQALYCSLACKKRDAPAHVFTCRMMNRPNDVDFLRQTIRKISKELQFEDDERVHNALIHLFADDHVCRTFGFNNCGDVLEVLHLVCLYATLLCRVRPAVRALQAELEAGTLGKLMESFCRLERDVARLGNTQECRCVTWFLDRWSLEAFPIPNRDKEHYDIWVVATNNAFESLNVAQRYNPNNPFSQAQRDVLDLYITIQPSLWRLPDVTSSTWIKFGFCYCKTFSQRLQLSKHYLSLAASSATFDEIVSAYETSSLADLMRGRGIDISTSESQGVCPCWPSPCEYSVFRFMVGVEHALSGRFCHCFRLDDRECHRPFETHLDRESDTNFGFRLTSSWEKWQLLNFYRHIFRQTKYDARRLAEVVHDPDRDGLEAYLDSLCPGMRKRLHWGQRANLLFPRLKDRMEMRRVDGSVVHSHLPCECKLHDVVGPPGLSSWSLDHLGLSAKVLT